MSALKTSLDNICEKVSMVKYYYPNWKFKRFSFNSIENANYEVNMNENNKNTAFSVLRNYKGQHLFFESLENSSVMILKESEYPIGEGDVSYYFVMGKIPLIYNPRHKYIIDSTIKSFNYNSKPINLEEITGKPLQGYYEIEYCPNFEIENFKIKTENDILSLSLKSDLNTVFTISSQNSGKSSSCEIELFLLTAINNTETAKLIVSHNEEFHSIKGITEIICE